MDLPVRSWGRSGTWRSKRFSFRKPRDVEEWRSGIVGKSQASANELCNVG